ncbi:MAG TPA: protein translocase subunit SecD [bacterium]|jgi:protein-export membrane protein SecD|nr:protein translocase subunit SecD [bacterium]
MVKRWVVIVTVLLTGFSLYKLYPGWFKGDFSSGMTPALNLGLDLQGGTYLKYEVEVDQIPKDAAGKPTVDTREAVDRAIEIVRNRVDGMGLKEPLIQREGDQYIVVQLPGDKDPDRTQRTIGATAQLAFKLVSDRYHATDYVDANGNTKEPLPDGIELMYDHDTKEPMLIESPLLMTGDMLATANVDFSGNQFGQPEIAFELTSAGEGLFASLTEENVGRRMAIILDGVVQSAPVIKGRIGGGRGVIEGQFTVDEAKDLALVLRSGTLPAPLKVVNKYVVGPTLGADTIRSGFLAALFGTLAVLLYIGFYYRVSGLIADLALIFNLVFLLGALAAFGATLTLPGIAGIVLTMGMSVDSNVIIFERIREELRLGKTVRASVDAGYKHAFWTIFDSHVTSLITALVLFQFGTGPIKGFAITLSLGVSISMFTALFVSKAVFDARRASDTLSI